MSTTVKDSIERVGATLVVAALGSLAVWLAAGAPTGKDAWVAAATPVVVALLDVVKVTWAAFLPSTTGASFVNLD